MITVDKHSPVVRHDDVPWSSKPWHAGLRLVITGTGKSGTTYMAALLNASGIACGHQSVFSWAGIRWRPEYEADASWIAAPYLYSFDGVVLHVVREPLACIRSLVGMDWFGNRSKKLDRGRRFLRSHFGVTGDDVRDAMRYYVEWNRSIEPYATHRVRLEDMPSPTLLLELGATRIGADVPHDTGRSPRHADVTLPAGPERDDLMEMAERYGYR